MTGSWKLLPPVGQLVWVRHEGKYVKARLEPSLMWRTEGGQEIDVFDASDWKPMEGK